LEVHACHLVADRPPADDHAMQLESSVTSISWIPSEAVTGIADVSFRVGFTHFDEPPPDHLGTDLAGSIARLRAEDRFRFVNCLAAFAEFDGDGRCVRHGYHGGGVLGSTTVHLGRHFTVAAVALPDRQAPPEIGDGWVRFRQTAGGRTGLPAPRPVRRAPFVQVVAPVAWTTLELVLYADGRAEGRLVGASPFPRHWIYGRDGVLEAKSGMTDFKDWAGHAFGRHTPWGDEDSPAFVAAVETALERELSNVVMRGGPPPSIRSVRPGAVLTTQGEPADDIILVLDGLVEVEIDGTSWAEVGPGSILGERAALEGGYRTATLRAVTPVRAAVVPAAQLDREKLGALSADHRREEHAAS
jgi:hypothetical protein